MDRFRRRGAVCAAVLALLAAGCSGGSDGDSSHPDSSHRPDTPDAGPAQPGGIYTTNAITDAVTLDPQKTTSAYTQQAVSGMVYSKLLEFATGRDIPYGSMEVRGDLAEDWSHSDDFTSWTFTLRHGVKFQNIAPLNGRELTADDVVCTVNRGQTLIGSSAADILKLVGSVSAPDKYTVQFTLTEPFVAFDQTAANPYLSILPCEGTSGGFDLTSQAIGTGPFILSEWKRDQERTYTNPEYFVSGRPYLDGVRVIILKDPAAAVAGFRSGELDTINGVSETLLPTIESDDVHVSRQYQLNGVYIGINVAAKPFDDIRVRRAVQMAWDRKGQAEAFGSEGAQLSGPINPHLDGGLSEDEQDELMPYDPEQAKKLLADAGYPDGFETEMAMTNAYGPDVVNGVQWVQQDLAKIGINVTLKQYDYPTLLQVFAAKEYSIGYNPMGVFLTPDEVLDVTYASTGSRNRFSTNDATLDKMIREQRSIADAAERTEALKEISRYIVTDVATPIMGYTSDAVSVQKPYVHDYWPHPEYSQVFITDMWLGAEAPGR